MSCAATTILNSERGPSVFSGENHCEGPSQTDLPATTMAKNVESNAENPANSAATSANLQSAELVFPAADVKHFVGGFHCDVTEANLREHFSQFGAVADVKIMRDPATNRSRGFGFVTMAEPSSKAKILAHGDHLVCGRKASVRPYSDQAEHKDSFTDGAILARKVFVGGVNPALGQDVLENYFSKYGPLEDATIMRYPDGRSRGFGFIVFRSELTCQQVLQQRNHHVTPRDRVEVKPCQPRGKARPAVHHATYGPPHAYGVQQGMFNGYGTYGAGTYGAGTAYSGGGSGYGGYAGSGYGAHPGVATPGGVSWQEYRGPGGEAAPWGQVAAGYDSYGYYGWGHYGSPPPTASGPYATPPGVGGGTPVSRLSAPADSYYDVPGLSGDVDYHHHVGAAAYGGELVYGSPAVAQSASTGPQAARRGIVASNATPGSGSGSSAVSPHQVGSSNTSSLAGGSQAPSYSSVRRNGNPSAGYGLGARGSRAGPY